jgi:hypothetical protein
LLLRAFIGLKKKTNEKGAKVMRHPLFLVMLLINSIHILKVEARKRITTMGKLGVSAHFTSGCFKCFSIIFLYAIFKRYFKKVSYGVYYYFLKNAFKKFYKTFFSKGKVRN